MIAVDLDDKNATAVASATRPDSFVAVKGETTPEDAAIKAMYDLVEAHNKKAMAILTDALLKIEALRTALDRRGQQQVKGVGEFAGFVSQTLAMADVIMGPINELAKTVTAATRDAGS